MQTQGKEKHEYRKPDEIWKNVELMRDTTFSGQKASFIDIDDDIKKYINYEINRIKRADVSFRGKQIYYLGLLNNEIDNIEQTVDYLNEYLESEEKTTDRKHIIGARTVLTKALIKCNRLLEASTNLTLLEVEGAACLDLIYIEMAKGHSKNGNKEIALKFAKKGLKQMKPDMIGYFLEHLIANFIREKMIDNAVKLLDEACDTTKASGNDKTLKNLITKKKQLNMILKPVPDVLFKDAVWLDIDPSPTEKDLESKIILLFYWEPLRDPCIALQKEMNRLVHEYKKKDLLVIGVARLKKSAGMNIDAKVKDVAREEELNKLIKYCINADLKFHNMFDEYNELESAMYVDSIPYIFLLDKTGLVRFFQNGSYYDRELLEGMVKELTNK